MNFKKTVLLSFAAVALMAAFVYPQVNPEQKEALLLQTLVRGMERFHYSPVNVDDAFSEKMYGLYLKSLDSEKRFFLASEVAQLEKYKHQLDNQLIDSDFTFFNKSTAMIAASITRAQGYYRDILSRPFDFNVKETMELDEEKRGFSHSEKALKQYWHEYLKYETLTRYAAALEKKAKGEDEEVAAKSDVELEADARADVLKMFDRWFDRMMKLTREDRMSQYLNAYTSVYDPHSSYYKPVDKKNFDIRFSGKLEGIGAQLQQDGDFTKVSSIVVGGPAWKAKELRENDVILKVAQGREEPVDIRGMALDDAVQLIRGDKGTEVRLTVRRVDGTEEVLSIIRDVVILDEKFAKSLIIDGETPGETIGYIYLPSFYADFEDRNGRHCADDVEIEIKKLKDAGVDGIILDLRNNGGGSLRDVVKMSGFFIKDGPIVQVKSKDTEVEVLADVNPAVQYEGPLVVMVNNFSASASEILAAALQDYGRAVVVGSNSTFGKGTVQRFVDLDRTLRGFDDIKPLGQVKLTTQKFYRINGGSTQLRGVVPDIILPDAYAYIKTGEKEEDYPMQWTEIEAATYSQKVLQVTYIDQIRTRSQARVAANEVFSKVNANALRMKEVREMTNYPLRLTDFQAFKAARDAEAANYKNLFDAVVNPSVKNLPVDLPAIENDESKVARNTDFLETVSKDVYIREVMSIIHDIIERERVAARN